MEFEFGDNYLEKAYYDPTVSVGHSPTVDRGFRKVVGKIRAANDERDLRALKGLHYHKLDGDRSHQHALDITDQWRLVVELIEEKGRIRLLIVSVEDYH
ncbi:MAG: type II toxin-antitoxin system RelE/ParE family toxin [Anaerolineaceae bacterium]|nr:type II toxin-antitoxin system RelE/ParE family toxin [Anaerolineaceae bacterium]